MHQQIVLQIYHISKLRLCYCWFELMKNTIPKKSRRLSQTQRSPFRPKFQTQKKVLRTPPPPLNKICEWGPWGTRADLAEGPTDPGFPFRQQCRKTYIRKTLKKTSFWAQIPSSILTNPHPEWWVRAWRARARCWSGTHPFRNFWTCTRGIQPRWHRTTAFLRVKRRLRAVSFCSSEPIEETQKSSGAARHPCARNPPS